MFCYFFALFCFWHTECLLGDCYIYVRLDNLLRMLSGGEICICATVWSRRVLRFLFMPNKFTLGYFYKTKWICQWAVHHHMQKNAGDPNSRIKVSHEYEKNSKKKSTAHIWISRLWFAIFFSLFSLFFFLLSKLWNHVTFCILDFFSPKTDPD